MKPIGLKRSIPLTQTAELRFQNINGAIRIDSWDRNEIKFEYVKVADTTSSGSSDLDVKIDAQRSHFKVKTEYDKTKRNNKKILGQELLQTLCRLSV